MRALKITLILLITVTAMGFVLAGDSFHPASVIPFCDGAPVNIYHWGGLTIGLVFLWGLYRLRRREDDD